MVSEKIYYGTFVDTPSLGDLRVRHDTAVHVDDNGKITLVESGKSFEEVQTSAAQQGTIIVSSNRPGATSFFFPGFIDTHTHASQYPNTGVFGNSTLLDWLDTYTFPLESSFSSPQRAAHVYNRVVSRSLSHGTTAVAYYATVHVPSTNLLADICLARGQRALVGRVCMDRLSPDHYRDESPEQAVSLSKASIDHIRNIDPKGALVRPVITPRFAPSCTMETMKALGTLQHQCDCHVQTHISENTNEIKMVRSQFPEHEHYTAVYDDAGLLSNKTILAHAVHLEPDEVALIKKRGTSISHCPTSNTCLTSGAAPIRQLLDAGVTVGLGTDMSGGYSPSILEMARQAILVSRHKAMVDGDRAKLNLEEALHLATVGGAKSMGLEGVVGAFEQGMDFDAQLISLAEVAEDATSHDQQLGPVDIFGWESWVDRIAKWLYSGDDRNVREVYIKGRLVHHLD